MEKLALSFLQEYFSLLCFLFTNIGFAQNELLDSLYTEVGTTISTVEQADIWLDIAEEEMGFSLRRSLQSAMNALHISEEIDDLENTGRSLSWMGRVYGELAEYDSALIVLTRAEKIFTEPYDSFYLAKVYNATGIIHKYTENIS